jgi:hypothetical protein
VVTTKTINGASHHVTDGDGVRGCVRAPEDPSDVLDRLSSQERTVRAGASHPHVIPDPEPTNEERRTPKVGNFASPHLREVREAVRGSWPLTESPQPLAVVARQVFPAKGEASNPAVWLGASVAGLFRLAVFSLAQLVQLAVATRIRAGVALTLLTLTVAASVVLPH